MSAEDLTPQMSVWGGRMGAGAPKLEPKASGADETRTMSPRTTNGVSPQPSCNKVTRNRISTEWVAQMDTSDTGRDIGPHLFTPVREPASLIEHTRRAGLLLECPSISVNTHRYAELQGIKSTDAYPTKQEKERAGLFQEYDLDISTFPGRLDFSTSNVDKYVESFKVNILNLHPIINPRDVDGWVKQFRIGLQFFPEKCHDPSRPVIDARAGSQFTAVAGSEKEHAQRPDSCGPGESPASNIGQSNNLVNRALVLIILALGKVCLYRDKIPGAFSRKDPFPYDSSATPKYGHLYSPDQDPSTGLPLHQYQVEPSPVYMPADGRIDSDFSRPSRDTSSTSGSAPKKNAKEIPGLDYFSCATRILDSHVHERDDIKNAYANIFASLYYGQLARPWESFRCIDRASSIWLSMVSSRFEELRGIQCKQVMIRNPGLNTLTLGFWSLLQLASDLVAEMDLAPPELLRDVIYEIHMPYPNMSLLDGFEQPVLDSFLAHIYLRKHLNITHRTFSKPQATKQVDSIKTSSIDDMSQAISNMDWVPPSFKFAEDDLPADSILAARLRAKYWGAQVVTFRPFVLRVLRYQHTVRDLPPTPGSTVIGKLPGIHPEVMKGAEKGIAALIESTRAFHRLNKERQIITNVFGTAHAQWGNLIVLTAAFKNLHLRPHISEQLLQDLFQKTIQFLRESAPESSSLLKDMHILRWQNLSKKQKDQKEKEPAEAVARYKQAEKDRIAKEKADKEAKDKEYQDCSTNSTRMARRYLSIESLREFGVEFDFDADPEYVLIRCWVPEREQDRLWKHTKLIREKRDRMLMVEDKRYSRDEPEFEWVREKEKRHHSRIRSKSPSLLMCLAGVKPA
ncbi:hypothetical protein FSARC_586 [Fusarium sarcochroum]|uniref:DUF8035 domain-containing protein n=1 Tax=Fusarium sarcochroum TaxID=1208366 RepID=A0A8H4XG95_9HYPO|nr:hypothetical protein FSARC_586 [Fusarium sarcochroum]